MKSVANASNKNSNGSYSSSSKYAYLAALLIGFVFVVSLSGSGNSGSKSSSATPSLRTGQVSHTTHQSSTNILTEKYLNDDIPMQSSPPSGNDNNDNSNNNNNNNNIDNGNNEKTKPSAWSRPAMAASTEVDIGEEVEAEMVVAEERFQEIVKDEVKVVLHGAIQTELNNVVMQTRYSLDLLFGDGDEDSEDGVGGNTSGNKNLDVTSEDLEQLTVLVERGLIDYVQETLKDRTDILVQEEEEEMEIEADLEAEDMHADNSADAEEIVQDLVDEEKELEQELVEEIDAEVQNILDSLKRKAALITKGLLEELLYNKTGNEYKIYFDEEDNVAAFKRKKKTSTGLMNKAEETDESVSDTLGPIHELQDSSP